MTYESNTTFSQRGYKIIKFGIAMVWMINGLYCKLLNQVPRHEMIVQRILHINHASLITKLIGFAEIMMCVWILLNYRSRFNAMTQIIIIGSMNILEFIMTPDLLLWGHWNAIFALQFMGLIGFNEFVLNKKTA